MTVLFIVTLIALAVCMFFLYTQYREIKRLKRLLYTGNPIRDFFVGFAVSFTVASLVKHVINKIENEDL